MVDTAVGGDYECYREVVSQRQEPSRPIANGISFQGEAVKIRRVGNGVLLEPMQTDVDAWFRDLDRYAEEPFMKEGRNQPKMPVRKVF